MFLLETSTLLLDSRKFSKNCEVVKPKFGWNKVSYQSVFVLKFDITHTIHCRWPLRNVMYFWKIVAFLLDSKTFLKLCEGMQKCSLSTLQDLTKMTKCLPFEIERHKHNTLLLAITNCYVFLGNKHVLLESSFFENVR